MIYKRNSFILYCCVVFGSFFDNFKALRTALSKRVLRINNGY